MSPTNDNKHIMTPPENVTDVRAHVFLALKGAWDVHISHT